MTAATTRSVQHEPDAGHVRPEDFRHRGACRSVDPEIFFPAAVQGREYERQVSIAKTVCAGCPVLAECLTWAVAHQPDGIAGGMTEHERRAEQRRRRDGRRAARLPQPGRSRRPVGGSRSEVAAAGRAALAAGRSVRDVAGEFLVSERTAGRWAAAIHTAPAGTTVASGSDVAEGSAGGNRAPLLISHNTPFAGDTSSGRTPILDEHLRQRPVRGRAARPLRDRRALLAL
ncbi:MAG: WhiB family transcriptional regulator [Pseudonocardia sp.]